MADLSYTDALTLRYRLLDLPLPDDVERCDYIAILTAGVRDRLLDELAALDDRRQARKDAAVAVSQSQDWARVAQRVRDRDNARRTGAFIERVIA